jgi:hypothetical protein
LDIGDCSSESLTDADKMTLINERQPEATFAFPPKIYKDKRAKLGVMKRYCSHNWFQQFEFLAYSKKHDGVYCLSCVLFPDDAHRRPAKLITEPYQNWKDAIADLKSHSANEYHKNSHAKLKGFMGTYLNPEQNMAVRVRRENEERVKHNRVILHSIIECLEFCGRQGIALRGHRDDGLVSADDDEGDNKGNFKELIKFRCKSGDENLRNHLEHCAEMRPTFLKLFKMTCLL